MLAVNLVYPHEPSPLKITLVLLGHDHPRTFRGGVIATPDFNNDAKPNIALQFRGASSGLVMLRNTTGTQPPPTPQAPTLLSPASSATLVERR